MPVIRLRDDLNRVVTLPAPARRIVSLSPAATENLFAVGAGRFVVGVTAADDYPLEVKKLPKAGDFGSPRYEVLVSLKPDLVVAESGTLSADTVRRIAERAGIPVFAQVSARYVDVEKHLRQLETLTNLPRGADKSVAALRAAETKVRKLAAGRKPVSVFFEVSRSPLYAAGDTSFIGDLIRIAGGTNAVRAGNTPYPMVSRESLVVADPDVYITAFGGAAPEIRAAPPLPAPLNILRASRTGHVFTLPVDLLFRPTPRLAVGLALLAQALRR